MNRVGQPVEDIPTPCNRSGDRTDRDKAIQ